MPITNPTAETHPERFGYRMPTLPFIGSRTPQGRMLESTETRRSEAIIHSTAIIGKLLGLGDLYKEALPEALAAVLESHDTHAADAAAIAYLRKRGYQITDKTEGF